MAASSIALELLTPLGSALPNREGEERKKRRASVDVPGVDAPGLKGELGVLPDHVPFITPVIPGVVRFRDGALDRRVAVGAGFLEVTDDGRVVILTERALDAGEVDVAAATAELKDVSAKLSKEAGPIDAADFRKLSDQQAWLEAQLRAAQA